MLNVAVIMGRLAADPELRHTPNGVAVTSFTLAVDRSYARAGTERQTDWIDVVAWRQTAEFVCKYFTKGQLMAVTGSIQTRNYEDRNGNKRKAVEIQATEVNFASSKREGGSMGGDPSYGQPRASAPAQPAAFSEPAPAYSSGSSEDFEEILGDDDLPF
ncbi:MAG TPA: single-stranded DNA-binding protein [Candidatus Acutalibacter pullicola]|uniref:Single-stranded DNA-binding protein n=1 Tax=Candidatus Acutalibacter pullicola TaxID=2838417 RepID=A0A9D2MV27_9FIRM|nr:single-stranded DNA-binding protein [Candidatus Acutalibacter pullicola]